MKGLFLRTIIAFALFLWAVDMVFPWQRMTAAEQNRYSAVQQRGSLIIGTVNNPISYFISPEGESGLEYELAKHFADYLGVALNIQVLNDTEALFTALENREIDIAAANLRFQPKRVEQFQIGPAYGSASWQVVYRKDATRPKTLSEIKQLHIANNAELNHLLQDIQSDYPDLNWQIHPELTQEELLLQVADGRLDYTIANSVEVSAAQQIRPQLAVGFDLTDETGVHWYLTNTADNELQAALLDFMNTALESGIMARLEEKYFRHIARFDYVDSRSYMNAIEKVLPKYQPLFEKYQGDLDWRLLAAVAYQESHWVPDATSPTGVRGMMMLTKATADRMKITKRTDPEQSIKAGAEYLHWLISQIPDSVPQEDRIWYALSAYNMGLGHLLDVRRLTKNLGGDPDNWLDVKKNLPLLAEKRYYTNLKYGYARGHEAFRYVENIRRYMNSIINYHRVQETRPTITENTTENDNAHTPHTTDMPQDTPPVAP